MLCYVQSVELYESHQMANENNNNLKPGLHWQLWEAISGSNATKNPKVASQNC
jgi:hypothetical protein